MSFATCSAFKVVRVVNLWRCMAVHGGALLTVSYITALCVSAFEGLYHTVFSSRNCNC